MKDLGVFTFKDNLRAKEVIIGDGERRRRYILCNNPSPGRRQTRIKNPGFCSNTLNFIQSRKPSTCMASRRFVYLQTANPSIWYRPTSSKEYNIHQISLEYDPKNVTTDTSNLNISETHDCMHQPKLHRFLDFLLSINTSIPIQSDHDWWLIVILVPNVDD